MHFHQKHVINNMDYPAWRPTSAVMAPFFFTIYLPKMGINVPGITLPDPSWPDIDWPQMNFPELSMPKIKLPDLNLLLKMRYPISPHPPSPKPKRAALNYHPLLQLGLRLASASSC